ncbi:hypothetical protein V1477_002862 [Vespula maculifrons]|uniref:Uncharacterized protein n=1 Tax=Vespula maculifrons TaxID=7453 RepID=A0ABD2CUZ0_VESMC
MLGSSSKLVEIPRGLGAATETDVTAYALALHVSLVEHVHRDWAVNTSLDEDDDDDNEDDDDDDDEDDENEDNDEDNGEHPESSSRVSKRILKLICSRIIRL